MAKINNQEVMQKLIDELKLYPGIDTIPTELAEKVLPVFLINEQNINVEETGDLILQQDTVLNDNDKEFTVPTGKNWLVKFGGGTYSATATVGNRLFILSIRDENDVIYWQETATANVTANNSARINISPNLGQSASQNSTEYALAIPNNLIMLPGHTIRLFENFNRDSNDDLLWSLLVREQTA